MDQLLTLQDIANLYGLNYSTLRYWKQIGKVPKSSGRVGKTDVWESNVIEAWAQENGYEKKGKVEGNGWA